MKSYTLLLIYLVLGLVCPSSLSAQSTPGSGNKFHFEFTGTAYADLVSPFTMHIPDTAVYQVLEAYAWKPDKLPKSPILLGVKLDPERSDGLPLQLRSLSKNYSSYFLTDGAEALVIAMGINKDNLNDFRYRVVENDSTELVPWSRIPGLEQKYGAKQPYGFIGKFKQPGKQLMIEVRNIQHYSIRDAVIFDWRSDVKPQLKQIGLFAHINGRTEYINVKDNGLSDGIDPKTNVPLNFKFQHNVVEDIQFFFDDHFGVPYSISVKGELDGAYGPFKSAVEHEYLDNSYMLPKRHFNYPGKYEIIVNRSDNFAPLSEKEVLRIPFVVLPEPFLSTPPRIETVIALSIVILTLSGLIFMIFYQRGKQKLRRAAQEKQMAGLQLKSIRSQLNPHFMFNALSSIQNLINKNHIEEANFYLSKFAGLTRQVLDSNNEEMISLEDEAQLLNDYLQMEQLRFNFNYELSIEERLNPANIEIPAMLLQPFIENAVKHGISGLKDRGQLSIKISSAGKDLILTIADNGRGFDKSTERDGYGLKLSEERIALLNQLYKEQALSLQIETKNTGTLITIRLSNWIP